MSGISRRTFSIGMASLAAATLHALAASNPAPAAPTRYSFLDLGTFGGTQSEARAISDSGRITGFANSVAPGTWREYDFLTGTWTHRAGNVETTNAFLYEARHGGPMVNIGIPGETSHGEAINNAGRVVGTVGSADNLKRAFRLGYGPLDETVDPGFFHPAINASVAGDINERNEIVGNTYLPGGHGAFVYRNNEMTSLGNLLGSPSWVRAINNHGEVAGESFVRPGYVGPIHAVVHDTKTGQTRDLGVLAKEPKPFDVSSHAFDISDDGKVVGVSHADGESFGAMRAFLHDGTQMIDLGTLPGSTHSDARALNERGQVVGRSSFRAFLWEDGAMYDLNALTDGLPSGWELEWANDINESGQIVGAVRNLAQGIHHAFLLTPNSADLAMSAALRDDEGAGLAAALGLVPGVDDDITQHAAKFSPSVNPVPLPEAAVPEPTALTLICTAASLTLLRRRRA